MIFQSPVYSHKFKLLISLAMLLIGCTSKQTANQPSPAIAESKVKAEQKRPQQAIEPIDVTDSVQFYGVYLAGKKAGWAKEEVRRTEDGGLNVATQIKLRIRRMGSEISLNMSDDVEYEPLPSGRLRRFELKQVQQDGSTTSRIGQLRGSKFDVTIESEGKLQTMSVPVPKERVEDVFPPLLVRRLRSEKGVLKTWQFDRQQLKDVAMETTLVSEKKTTIQGLPVTVLKVQSVDKARGITLLQRMTEAGRSLEITLGPGLKLVLEDREVAKNPAVSVPDLYAISQVPIDKPLGNANDVNSMTVRFDGMPPSLNLNDSRQTMSNGQLRVVRLAPEAVKETELSEAERTQWLAVTPFIDHKAGPIIDLATKHAQNKRGFARIAALSKTVHRTLKYTLATAPLTASRILAERRGDCTEYSRLLVALCRALGLPAREVSGMAYAGDGDPGFAFHAWVEVYVDGRWVAADPTWDQFPIDATHIAISRDDPSAIVGMLGGLKAQLVAVERSN